MLAAGWLLFKIFWVRNFDLKVITKLISGLIAVALGKTGLIIEILNRLNVVVFDRDLNFTF
jgi:hypothetical protein